MTVPVPVTVVVTHGPGSLDHCSQRLVVEPEPRALDVYRALGGVTTARVRAHGDRPQRAAVT